MPINILSNAIAMQKQAISVLCRSPIKSCKKKELTTRQREQKDYWENPPSWGVAIGLIAPWTIFAWIIFLREG